MSAYNELYLNDSMTNLGVAFDYAINTLEYDAESFANLFAASKAGTNFEKGNPKFLVGMSGLELVNTILKDAGVSTKQKEYIGSEEKSPEYWAGWILAFYQWYSGLRFCDLFNYGLDIEQILSMYILHEADVTKFVASADKIIRENKAKECTRLQTMRKLRGLTQKELSEEAGVSLRMIQLYEQGQNDISKAAVDTVVKLANSLGCDVYDLI